MKSKINQRKEGDKTRLAILKAATKLFAEKGFSGTATAAIAKAAKVNEALIYYHFGNKTELWKKVKEDITDKGRVGTINPKPDSLREFLQEAIQQRLYLYDNSPVLHKIKQWQRLESRHDKLAAPNLSAPNTWIPSIHYLQQHHQMKESLSAELVVLWLTASINVIIDDESAIFHNQNVRSDYIQFIIEGFAQVLA